MTTFIEKMGLLLLCKSVVEGRARTLDCSFAEVGVNVESGAYLLVAEDLRDGFHINSILNSYCSEAMAELMGGGSDADVLFIVLVEGFKSALCQRCRSRVGDNVGVLCFLCLNKLCSEGSKKRDYSASCFCLWLLYIRFIAFVSY